MKITKLQIDIIERAVWTAIQAFVAYFAVSGNSGWKAAAASAIAAGISVIKGRIGSFIGNSDSASTTTTV